MFSIFCNFFENAGKNQENYYIQIQTAAKDHFAEKMRFQFQPFWPKCRKNSRNLLHIELVSRQLTELLRFAGKTQGRKTEVYL